MIIAVLLFLLVYTIYTSSIPLPDVVNHVDDHITVGFSQIETDNPWRTTQINSFREAFGPSNIDFIYHEPEEYTAKWQQEDITELIREKVDYLVIVPADLDALVPALQSAKEAGIPVIPAHPDGALNQVGSGALGDGVMTLSAGTSGAIRMAFDRPYLPVRDFPEPSLSGHPMDRLARTGGARGQPRD